MKEIKEILSRLEAKGYNQKLILIKTSIPGFMAVIKDEIGVTKLKPHDGFYPLISVEKISRIARKSESEVLSMKYTELRRLSM